MYHVYKSSLRTRNRKKSHILIPIRRENQVRRKKKCVTTQILESDGDGKARELYEPQRRTIEDKKTSSALTFLYCKHVKRITKVKTQVFLYHKLVFQSEEFTTIMTL